MSRASLVLGALMVFGWSSAALANGGGYAFGIKFTGGIAPFQPTGTEGVRIVEERLDIQLRRMDAAVVVRYAMHNPTDKAVQVRFGFPVEASLEPDWDGPSEGQPDYADYQRRRIKGTYQALKGYQVALDGRALEAVFELEPFAKGRVKPFPGSGVLKGIAAWMVTEASFPPGTTTLEIRYSADHFRSGTYVSDDDRGEPGRFVYRLSSGAVWRGPIAKGTISIRADGIPSEEVEIEAPRGRFERNADGWTWAFTDLEPTLADDIRVRATPGYLEVGAYGEEGTGVRSYLERAGSWGASHQRFKARASSTLASVPFHAYVAQNVAEDSGKDPWCEGVGGPGVGEWLELTPSAASPLLGIGVLPGVVASGKHELFSANATPVRVEIALNDEHRFVATLGDRIANQFIPVIGYPKAVSKVRITILDVRPGARFEDTCVSRIVLYDRLKKMPAMRGAR